MSDCILFEGATNEDGYGVTGTKKLAHRDTWEKVHGQIPPGKHVLHTCDNPPCINEEHLFLGTHQDNMKDRDNKNRQARPIGSSNGRSILHEQDVVEIKKHLQDENLSLQHIANCYGVCKSTIVHIKQGRAWSHVLYI